MVKYWNLQDTYFFFLFKQKNRHFELVETEKVNSALTSNASCLGCHLLFLKEEEWHLEPNKKCFGPFPLPHSPLHVILKGRAGQKRNGEKHLKVQIIAHSFPIKPFPAAASPCPRSQRCTKNVLSVVGVIPVVMQ